jgi:hypothetical protein
MQLALLFFLLPAAFSQASVGDGYGSGKGICLEIYAATHEPYFSCTTVEDTYPYLKTAEEQKNTNCFPLIDYLKDQPSLVDKTLLWHYPQIFHNDSGLRDFIESAGFSPLDRESTVLALYVNKQLNIQESSSSSRFENVVQGSFEVPIYMVLNMDQLALKLEYCLNQISGVWRSVGVIMGCSLGAGCIIYFFERGHHQSDFKHPLHGLYFAIVTLTGCGYGDKVPRSVEGRTLSTLWMLAGVILFAFLTGVLTSNITGYSSIIGDPLALIDATDARVGAVLQTASAKLALQSTELPQNVILYTDIEAACTGFFGEEVGVLIADKWEIEWCGRRSTGGGEQEETIKHSRQVKYPTGSSGEQTEAYQYWHYNASDSRERPVERSVLTQIRRATDLTNLNGSLVDIGTSIATSRGFSSGLDKPSSGQPAISDEVTAKVIGVVLGCCVGAAVLVSLLFGLGKQLLPHRWIAQYKSAKQCEPTGAGDKEGVVLLETISSKGQESFLDDTPFSRQRMWSSSGGAGESSSGSAGGQIQRQIQRLVSAGQQEGILQEGVFAEPLLGLAGSAEGAGGEEGLLESLLAAQSAALAQLEARHAAERKSMHDSHLQQLRSRLNSRP